MLEDEAPPPPLTEVATMPLAPLLLRDAPPRERQPRFDDAVGRKKDAYEKTKKNRKR